LNEKLQAKVDIDIQKHFNLPNTYDYYIGITGSTGELT
jgi:hypothetical protein